MSFVHGQSKRWIALRPCALSPLKSSPIPYEKIGEVFQGRRSEICLYQNH